MADSIVLSGATFTDANPGNHTSDFTATITWGDGDPSSPGTVTYDNSSGAYTVNGSHTYAAEGSYPISIAVVDVGGSTATITVRQDGATVTVSGPSVVLRGQAVSFTATVTANLPGGGTPTGNVTFVDGNTTLGTSPLVNGQATLSNVKFDRSFGSHTITAKYIGDPNFPGNGGSQTVIVSKGIGNTTTLAASPSVSAFGYPTTFTVTVHGSKPGTPTGSVQFIVDGSNFGPPMNLVKGKATLSTATLLVGKHTITASYGGDANFRPEQQRQAPGRHHGQAGRNSLAHRNSVGPDGDVRGGT